MNVNETYARIGDYIRSHESESYSQIGSKLALTRATVARIARQQGIRRSPGRRPTALQAAVAAINAADAQAGSVASGEAAAPPREESVSAVPDALPAAEAPSAAPGAPRAEGAVA